MSPPAKKPSSSSALDASPSLFLSMAPLVLTATLSCCGLKDLCRISGTCRLVQNPEQSAEQQLREMSLDDVHYADRVCAAQLDQHNAVGEETLAALCEKHTKRLVTIGLTNRNCTWCGEETDYFFELACARVCGLCYANNPGAKMCSLKYAKVLYGLDEQQLAELPQATLSDSTIVTLDVAARDCAIKRAGSEAAAMQQLQQRKTQAQARYDAQLGTAKGRRVRVPLILQDDGATHLLAKAGELAVSNCMLGVMRMPVCKKITFCVRVKTHAIISTLISTSAPVIAGTLQHAL
eukprot:4162-Heterococcus_DN1.PRE.2